MLRLYVKWALNAAVEKRKETLVGTAIVLLGVPFYLYWKRRRKAAVSI